MVEAAATPAWVLLAYLIAGVCFILALRGLSGPESSRRGNRTGMLGMAIAVVTTLIVHFPTSTVAMDGRNVTGDLVRLTWPVSEWSTFGEILAAMAVGGASA